MTVVVISRDYDVDYNAPPPIWTPSLHTYHQDAAWGSGMLSTFRENPRLAWHMYVEKSIPRGRQTAETILGSIVHLSLMLDAWKLGETCLEVSKIVDVGDRRAKAFKDAQDELPEGSILMTRTELAEATKILHGVWHPETPAERGARRLFFDCPGWSEYSLRCEWEPGLDVKVRLDRLVEVPGVGLVLADVKTSRDPGPENFERGARYFGYPEQLALQELVLERVLGIVPDVVMLVAIRNDDPYETCLYQVSRDLLDAGRQTCLQALADLAEALQDTETMWTQNYEREIKMMEAFA